MTIKKLTRQYARWAENIAAYDFIIWHKKGKENQAADALSRSPEYEGINP
jgi:hypothetical protein